MDFVIGDRVRVGKRGLEGIVFEVTAKVDYHVSFAPGQSGHYDEQDLKLVCRAVYMTREELEEANVAFLDLANAQTIHADMSQRLVYAALADKTTP